MQCVRFEYLEARFFAPSFAKMCREGCIEFYRGNAVSVSQQTFCESAAARADLDHERRVIAACSFCDAIESLAFDEEMLAEFLARQSLRDFLPAACGKTDSFTVAAR